MMSNCIDPNLYGYIDNNDRYPISALTPDIGGAQTPAHQPTRCTADLIGPDPISSVIDACLSAIDTTYD
jgi:hypothetical protein